jgi:hypothetical protein
MKRSLFVGVVLEAMSMTVPLMQMRVVPVDEFAGTVQLPSYPITQLLDYQISWSSL